MAAHSYYAFSEKLSLARDYGCVNFDIFAAFSCCNADCVFHTAAAGNFHSRYGYTAYVVETYDFGQLIGIVFSVQLGAPYESDFSIHELSVKSDV